MTARELVECPVIVGTAGHVDHGKSALIEALTGKNPDRLEVERRRGMTTELGFGETYPGMRTICAPWCRAPPAWTLRYWRFRPLRA